jgi:hypothetical protein
MKFGNYIVPDTTSYTTFRVLLDTMVYYNICLLLDPILTANVRTEYEINTDRVRLYYDI